MTIKENYLVKKQNVLNELRSNNLTLQELRFFSIYLSKINPNDVNTRVVRFSLSDFKSIMELGRLNINYLQQVTNSLLCKVVNVPNERGGYNGFQVFKRCRVDVDEKCEWYVEIDAHDDALPLMFEFKERFFTYQLWNALRLKSSNQLRMYEILKQYEKIGERIISVEELRLLLGIDKDEYSRFGDFKTYVLIACQQALEENTDIKYTFEPTGRKGKGGKVLFLKFYISKNTAYIDQLTLDRFIIEQQEHEEIKLEEPGQQQEEKRELTGMLYDVCNKEFSAEQIQQIADIISQLSEEKKLEFIKEHYNYVVEKKIQPERRFNYLTVRIKNEIEKEIKKAQVAAKAEKDKPSDDYDIDDYVKLSMKRLSS